MKVTKHLNRLLTLYPPLAYPPTNNNALGAYAFINILLASGEISTIDEALLTTKFKTLNTNVIPKLVKYGYIKKRDRKVDKEILKTQYGTIYDKRERVVRAGHILTTSGKKALEVQNKDIFGYYINKKGTKNTPTDIRNRNQMQDVASLLVLFELLGIDYSYNSHPPIVSEFLYSVGKSLKTNEMQLIEKSLEKCISDKPIGYSFNIYSKTSVFLDKLFGLICKGFICQNEECFPVYVFDNYDINSEQRRFNSHVEHKKIKEIFSTKDIKKLTPYNYPIDIDNSFLGNAFCTVANEKNIQNIFDIKKKPLKYIDQYGLIKSKNYKIIKSLSNIGYRHVFLLVRNFKYLKEQYALDLASYSDKQRINQLFLEDFEDELDKAKIFLPDYYIKNKYKSKGIKYGFDMTKVSPAEICPTENFTIYGNPMYLLWELDVAKINRAVLDFSKETKYFFFFEEQKDIALNILYNFKINDVKLGIEVFFIPMQKALNIIDQ